MAMEITTYIIDACALIAYLREEKGAGKLKKILKNHNNRLLMHSVNLGEVYYCSFRTSGKEKADELFEDILKLPIHIIWTLDFPFIQIVGTYKTSHRISYADSFVLALAEQKEAIIISTDHHEFDIIESEKKLSFYWLR